MTETEERYSDLLFGIRRSVRYHRRRERFLAGCATWFKILTAGAGTSTVVSLLAGTDSYLINAAAAATAVFSVLDIVFAPERTARTHNSLAQDFIRLEQDMLQIGHGDDSRIDPGKLIDLEARRLTIEAQEPLHLRALNLMCHNDLVKATGKSTRQYVDIPFYSRLLSQIIDVSTHRLEKRDREIAARS